MVALCVLAAALLYSLAGYFMKLSNGMTAPGPASLVVGFVLLGAGLQALAMRDEPMSVVYVAVLGLEAVAALLLGMLLLGEQGSPGKLVGVGLVLVGIGLLQTDLF